MNVPIWATQIAGEFWSEVGKLEPFPRRLIGPIAEATCLSVVFVPRLSISAMQDHLCQLGIGNNLSMANRPLRACLVAARGYGLIFMDGTDPENEQRFSIAHELAHFLRDYCYPRRRVVKRLGLAAVHVLDGMRLPTNDERIHGLLQQMNIGFHIHLMDRIEGRNRLPGPIADAENCADRLAYELLAPAETIASVAYSLTAHPDRATVANLLATQFALPEQQACHYAALLVPFPRQADPLLKWLNVDSQSVELRSH